nr:MAG TPA: hypothetical protein [Caudoviricetes sp.]
MRSCLSDKDCKHRCLTAVWLLSVGISVVSPCFKHCALLFLAFPKCLV